VTKRASILLASFLLSACEFTSIGVPPLPGVPLGTTANTNTSAPPTEAQIQAMSTPELCWYIAFAEYFETRESAWLELDARAAYTEEEMALISARTIDVGMSSSAVRCIFGPPRDVLTRGIDPDDDYDVIHVYPPLTSAQSGGLVTTDSGPRRETRIYFEDDLVVRVDEPPPVETRSQRYVDTGNLGVGLGR
jgi:hypothetical protein